MSDFGIKITIVLAAIAVAIGARFIPNSSDKQLVEKVAEEVIQQEASQI
jgi:hypothetical protein